MWKHNVNSIGVAKTINKYSMQNRQQYLLYTLRESVKQLRFKETYNASREQPPLPKKNKYKEHLDRCAMLMYTPGQT